MLAIPKASPIPMRSGLRETARLDWLKPPTRMGNSQFDPVDIRWFEDGILNASANCLDRHDPETVAII